MDGVIEWFQWVFGLKTLRELVKRRQREMRRLSTDMQRALDAERKRSERALVQAKNAARKQLQHESRQHCRAYAEHQRNVARLIQFQQQIGRLETQVSIVTTQAQLSDVMSKLGRLLARVNRDMNMSEFNEINQQYLRDVTELNMKTEAMNETVDGAYDALDSDVFEDEAAAPDVDDVVTATFTQIQEEIKLETATDLSSVTTHHGGGGGGLSGLETIAAALAEDGQK